MTICIDIYQKIFEEFGCEAKWIVFMDADYFIVDFNRTMESMIADAGVQRRNQTKPCKFIAQDSPNTANSGFLFFKMSSFSHKFLRIWLSNIVAYQFPWCNDQGYLQQTVLQYVEHELQLRLHHNCAHDKYVNLRHNYHTIPEDLRNLCYVKSMANMQLHPGDRSLGSVCLVNGFTNVGMFNYKDWHGSYHWNTTECSLYWVHDHCNNNCNIPGQFGYHGKEGKEIVGAVHNYRCFLKHVLENSTFYGNNGERFKQFLSNNFPREISTLASEDCHSCMMAARVRQNGDSRIENDVRRCREDILDGSFRINVNRDILLSIDGPTKIR